MRPRMCFRVRACGRPADRAASRLFGGLLELLAGLFTGLFMGLFIALLIVFCIGRIDMSDSGEDLFITPRPKDDYFTSELESDETDLLEVLSDGPYTVPVIKDIGPVELGCFQMDFSDISDEELVVAATQAEETLQVEHTAPSREVVDVPVVGERFRQPFADSDMEKLGQRV